MQFADWVGDNLRTAIQELANDFWMSGSSDPEATFERLNELVAQYSPVRARKDFIGSVARGFSSVGFGSKTKE